jgi:cell division protease FtsH
VFGDVTTGAHDDIRNERPTSRARWSSKYGMSKLIGAVSYGARNENAFGIGFGSGTSASPGTAEEIEQEVRGILERCHSRALEILIRNRALLEEMSLFLFENEVLDGDVMNGFLGRTIQLDSLEDRPTAEWVPEELLDDQLG